MILLLININVFMILRVRFVTFSSSFFRHRLFLFYILRIILFMVNFSFFTTFLILRNLFLLFFILWIKIYNVWQNIFFLNWSCNCLFCCCRLCFFLFMNFIDFSFISSFCFWLNSIVTLRIYMISIEKDIFKIIKNLLKLF